MGLKDIFNQNSKDISGQNYLKNNQDLMKNLSQKNNNEQNKLPFGTPRGKFPATGSGGPQGSSQQPKAKPASGIRVLKPISIKRKRDMSGGGV